MCGILTYFSKTQLDNKTVEEAMASLQSIRHRGPDGEGMVLVNTQTGEYTIVKTPDSPDHINAATGYNAGDYNMIMGHRRLAIFDLSPAGHQPMTDVQQQCIIVFNGEIYNFKELREELKAAGYVFTSDTDTEVIIKAYRHWGTECLSKFNGMWAFVLFDTEKKKVFMSRDRYGIKPIVYHTLPNGDRIAASEEKQMFAFTQFKKAPNRDTLKLLVEQQLFGVNLNTFYEGVYHFKPAAYVYGSHQAINPAKAETFYTIPAGEVKYTYSQNDKAIAAFNSHFRQALDFTLRADVPVGLGFSGGVDSSRIVYECYNHFQKPETFSAVFPGNAKDESPYINIVKEHIQLKSNFCYPEKEYNDSDFETLTRHLDTPVPTASYYAKWRVARLVKTKNIKVLLVGQGADEVFAGYHHHFYRYMRGLFLTGRWLTLNKAIKAYAEMKQIAPKALWRILYGELKLLVKIKLKGQSDMRSQWYLPNNLTASLMRDLDTYQIPYFLQSDDRIGMAFQYESRYPFLDHELVNFGFHCSDDLKIQQGWQKWLIRASNTEAPESIIWRKDKVGFRMPDAVFGTDNKAAESLVKKYTGTVSANHFINSATAVWLKMHFE